jgi:hypothetical protein
LSGKIRKPTIKMKHKNDHTQTLILTAEQGRVYNLGAMTAIFKADENETDNNIAFQNGGLIQTLTDQVHINMKTRTRFFMCLKALFPCLLGTNG